MASILLQSDHLLIPNSTHKPETKQSTKSTLHSKTNPAMTRVSCSHLWQFCRKFQKSRSLHNFRQTNHCSLPIKLNGEFSPAKTRVASVLTLHSTEKSRREKRVCLLFQGGLHLWASDLTLDSPFVGDQGCSRDQTSRDCVERGPAMRVWPAREGGGRGHETLAKCVGLSNPQGPNQTRTAGVT